MLIIRILNYFKGYVLFSLEGLNLERVLNLAASKGIYIWDIVRKDYTTIEGKVRIDGYKQFKSILRKTGCKSKIKLKVGYPFFLFKLKRKRTVILGIIISVILLALFSSFIWSIKVYGNHIVKNEEIIHSLKDIGIYKGILKYKIDLEYIKDSLLIEFDKIIWMGIDIKGTVLEIRVVEKKEPISKIHSTQPCDIVAKKRGIIERVIGRNGDEVVKKGDIVKPNDVLISGTIVRDYDTLRYVHADGEVWAKTYYESVGKSAIFKLVKIKTGSIITKRIVNLGGFTINFGRNDIPFDKYIVESKKKSLPKWRNIKIPVEILIEEYYEVNEKKEKIPVNILKKSLQDKLLIKIMNNIPEDTEIIDKKFSVSQNKDSVTIELVIEALEQIGEKRKINMEERITEDNNKEE